MESGCKRVDPTRRLRRLSVLDFFLFFGLSGALCGRCWSFCETPSHSYFFFFLLLRLFCLRLSQEGKISLFPFHSLPYSNEPYINPNQICAKEFTGHASHVLGLKFSSDGKLCLSAAKQDRFLSVWDCHTDTPSGTLSCEFCSCFSILSLSLSSLFYLFFSLYLLFLFSPSLLFSLPSHLHTHSLSSLFYLFFLYLSSFFSLHLFYSLSLHIHIHSLSAILFSYLKTTHSLITFIQSS
jgi:WD40 repeat protein